MNKLYGIRCRCGDKGGKFLAQQMHMRPYIQEGLVLAGVAHLQLKGLHLIGLHIEHGIYLVLPDAAAAEADDFHFPGNRCVLEEKMYAADDVLGRCGWAKVYGKQDHASLRHDPSEFTGKIFVRSARYPAAV